MMARNRENRTLPFSAPEWEAAKAVAEAEGLPSRAEYFRSRIRKDCKRLKIDLQKLQAAVENGLPQVGEQE
jgi:hypothetical protein